MDYMKKARNFGVFGAVLYKITAILIYALGALALVAIFGGCMTTKKQKRIATQYYAENRKEFAEDCEEAFPIKDSIIPGKTIYIPADNPDLTPTLDSLTRELEEAKRGIATVLIDTSNCPSEYDKLVAKFNKAVAQIQQLKTNYKPCDPDSVIVEGDTIIKEDTRKVEKLTIQLKESEKGRETWRTLFIIFVILFILSAAYNFYLIKYKK